MVSHHLCSAQITDNTNSLLLCAVQHLTWHKTVDIFLDKITNLRTTACDQWMRHSFVRSVSYLHCCRSITSNTQLYVGFRVSWIGHIRTRTFRNDENMLSAFKCTAHKVHITRQRMVFEATVWDSHAHRPSGYVVAPYLVGVNVTRKKLSTPRTFARTVRSRHALRVQ